MWKKFIAIIIALIVVAAGCTYILDRYQAHLSRQQQYQAAQNSKAEEINLTVLEGWNNKEIGDYLEKQKVITSGEFAIAVKNHTTREHQDVLPKEASGNLQGFLYPDTYRFFKSITDRAQTPAAEAGNTIIKKLLDNFFKKLPSNAEALAKKQGLSLYQAITLASIVEKETNNSDTERKIIAGIFYNRLKIGMPLQSDATINYITGKNDPGVSDADLAIESAYNTYKHKGLPPTPIANPSLSAILAVLEPAQTDYLYFLHNQTTGQPVYAKTFQEHVSNKQKYLQ